MTSPSVVSAGTISETRSLRLYCEKWIFAFRQLGQEVRSLSDVLLKWTAYDQGSHRQPPGSKWTKEEEERLKQALLMHGTDMDKIIEAMGTRTEQAIKAAVKRKMDPELVQRLGPLKRRRTTTLAEEDNSQQKSVDIASGEGSEDAAQQAPTNATSGDAVKTLDGAIAEASQFWNYVDSDVTLDDNDFLFLLEDDASELGQTMALGGIPCLLDQTRYIKEVLRPEDMLKEIASPATDVLFAHKFGKKTMLQICLELGVYKPVEKSEEREAVVSELDHTGERTENSVLTPEDGAKQLEDDKAISDLLAQDSGIEFSNPAIHDSNEEVVIA